MARHSRNSNADTDDRIIIGWREYVALPEWGIDRIIAKIDTGAKTSAIDCRNLVELEGNRARFDVVINRDHTDDHLSIVAPIVRRTRVKSSFGASHDRLVVRTVMRLGSVEKPIELTLVSRRNMLCRMLIGRRALEPEFLVDSSHRYLQGKRRHAAPSQQPRERRKRPQS